MIASMSAEKTGARRFGDKKAEQIEVKVPARLEIRRVETKVTQTADFERSVQSNAANVVFDRGLGRHGNLPSRIPSYLNSILTRSVNQFFASQFPWCKHRSAV